MKQAKMSLEFLHIGLLSAIVGAPHTQNLFEHQKRLEEVPKSKTLTFILERHDSIGYYDGLAKEIKYVGFGAMRNIIQQKQSSLVKNHINKDELIVIIKPTSESSYKNFVDVMDEISINDCKHYFVAEPEE